MPKGEAQSAVTAAEGRRKPIGRAASQPTAWLGGTLICPRFHKRRPLNHHMCMYLSVQVQRRGQREALV